MKTQAYAALSATTPMVPHAIERRELRDEDVAIEILYSGVCHSDLQGQAYRDRHQAAIKGSWSFAARSHANAGVP